MGTPADKFDVHDTTKIKKAYPIVVVTVVDTEEHTTEIIKA